MAKPLRSVWEEPATRYNEDAPWVQRAMRSEKWKRRVLGFLAFVAVPVALIAGMGAFSAASRLSGTAGVDPAAVSSEKERASRSYRRTPSVPISS